MVGNYKRSSFKFEFPVPVRKTFKPEIGKRKEEREKRKEDKGNHPARLA
jgi:hypothetical protein